MTTTVPIETSDPINARILAVSEDRIQGFFEDPLGEIALQARLDRATVVERIAAMRRAGTIRRVRQTLMSTNLARGALVAWQVPEEKLHSAFDWMFQNDPFSGHVVIRSTDAVTSGSKYRLWTTLKVPQGYSMDKHCRLLCKMTGADRYLLLPAKRLFALGVGHVRRRGMEPGSKSDELADVTDTQMVPLSDLDWRVLISLKREFTADEMESEVARASRPCAVPATGETPVPRNSDVGCASAHQAGADGGLKPTLRTQHSLWSPRADEAGVPLEAFLAIAKSLNERHVIGRFSTFLEHVKPLASGERVTKFNALFHWAVPPGREIDAGRQVGRFHIMTHAYWREGGPEFGHVNIMGVAHGQDKGLLLAHKRAIDQHLAAVGIPVSYTNVFWGGRSEIKPSEISPQSYREFCAAMGMDAEEMRE